MKARVKIEGDVLEITFTGVQESDRGRMANIEIALLRQLGSYKRLPWVEPRVLGKPDSEGWLVQIVRGDSTHGDAETARKVLRGFTFDV